MKVELWGVYPPPIGGISMYCKRLVETLYNRDENISLLNFAKSKSSLPYIKNVRFAIIEIILLPFKSRRIIHLQLRNVLFLSFLFLFSRKHIIIITLHNRKMLLLKGLRKKIISLFFNRVKYIIYNDFTYTEQFLPMYKVDINKIVVLPTYIPPFESEKKGVTPDIEKFCESHKYLLSTNANILVRNVWGDVYGFDQLIELMNRLVNGEKMDVGLIFMLAQIGDKEYYTECVRKISELGLTNNFLIVVNSKVNGFEVWEKTNLFIRATMSDMEGISVKEALQFGVPVIASAVCCRPQQAVLYEPGNVCDLFEKTVNLLNSRERVEYQPDVDVPSEIYKIYNKLMN